MIEKNTMLAFFSRFKKTIHLKGLDKGQATRFEIGMYLLNKEKHY